MHRFGRAVAGKPEQGLVQIPANLSKARRRSLAAHGSASARQPSGSIKLRNERGSQILSYMHAADGCGFFGVSRFPLEQCEALIIGNSALRSQGTQCDRKFERIFCRFLAYRCATLGKEG